MVNKNEVGNFKKDYRKIVEQITNTKLPKSIKADYSPISILSKQGFSNVLEKRFLHTEKFTIPRAIKQIQSMSLWNFIPDNKKEEALKIFKNHFEQSNTNGIIYRQLEIVVVSGKR